MMWAKEHTRLIARPRIMLMSLFTLSICLLSLTAFAEDEKEGYAVTRAEAEDRLAEALHNQGVGEDVQASIIGRRTEELVRHQSPLVMEITGLQADTSRNTFSAKLAFYTEAALDQPSRKLGTLEVNGRYDVMQEVPVTKARTTSGTVLTEADIEWQKMPSSRLDRNTILNADEIIGKTPVRVIAAGRPMEPKDLQVPPVINRQSTVYMNYKSANIAIQAVGIALQDGAVGDRIRVRNSSGGNTVEGVVTAPNQVQVLPAPHAVRLAETHASPMVQAN